MTTLQDIFQWIRMPQAVLSLTVEFKFSVQYGTFGLDCAAESTFCNFLIFFFEITLSVGGNMHSVSFRLRCKLLKFRYTYNPNIFFY